MLRSHNQQYVELDFFTSFLNNAIKGDQAYLRIIEPIILDAASLARHEKNIADIDRTGLNIKLFLYDWGSTNLKLINADNLSENLTLILNIINDHRNTVMA